MFTFNLFVPFSHSVEISFLHPFKLMQRKAAWNHQNQSLRDSFLLPQFARFFRAQKFFHPSLHSPVKSTSQSLSFLDIIWSNYTNTLALVNAKKNTPSSIHFHSGSPSLSLAREKKTFDRSIPPNLAFSLNQIIIPVLFSRVLLCCEFRYSSFLLSLRLLLSCLGFLKNLFI